MYIGRIAAVGQTPAGRFCAGYRVSSRSFPNRTVSLDAARASVVPREGHESDIMRNPYIAYNCVRIVCGGNVAVVTNGAQTDPVAEKIEMGTPARDALILSLLALDFERDKYNTPRIAAVADKRGDRSAWLAVVRDDGLETRRVSLEAGCLSYVATYEENSLVETQRDRFTGESAADMCRHILGQGVFAERERPVTAVGVVETDTGFEMYSQDAGV